MHLLILRHGEAKSSDGNDDDFVRSLTAAGTTDAYVWLSGLGI